jgi:hypothetical protein
MNAHVNMFNHRMEEMDKNMDTSSELLSFIKNNFEEGQDSLISDPK